MRIFWDVDAAATVSELREHPDRPVDQGRKRFDRLGPEPVVKRPAVQEDYSDRSRAARRRDRGDLGEEASAVRGRDERLGDATHE